MPHAARQFPDAPPAARVPLVAPRWIAGGGAIDSPVRDLHDRLSDAFGGTLAPVPVRRGLPIALRGAVIVTASLTLWSAIGIGVYHAI